MSEIRILPHHHNETCEKMVGHIPDTETIGSVAETMKQLGDSSRPRIFWILCHTKECVANIAALVDMSSPAVSHHLKILKSAGLIVSRRAGKEMLYRAADTEIVRQMHLMIESLAEITCPSGN